MSSQVILKGKGRGEIRHHTHFEKMTKRLERQPQAKERTDTRLWGRPRTRLSQTSGEPPSP